MSMPLQEFLFNQAAEEPNYQALPASTLTSNSLQMLRQQLAGLLKDGYPSVRCSAKAAGMSLRSFQRHLAKDHLSYSRLVDQIRFETALRLLQDPSIKLIEISLELGYGDAASFTRAFKRWTGMSPNQFRRMSATRRPFQTR